MQAHQREVRVDAQPHDLAQPRAAALADALRDQLASNPDYARVFTIEILAAGPEAHERRRKAQERYVNVMRAWHRAMRELRPELGPLPDQVFETAVTAGNELVAQCIRERGGARLGEIVGLCVYTYLALMGLHEEARAALEPDGA